MARASTWMILLALVPLIITSAVNAWTGDVPASSVTTGHLLSKLDTTTQRKTTVVSDRSDRRRALLFGMVSGLTAVSSSKPAVAYTPDSDKLRESLYLMSRVQEATVQQERFASNAVLQEELKKKLSLSLRLVDRSYRILDQINFASQYVEPASELVTATEAGYKAAEALQEAIDFVKSNALGSGINVTEEQRSFLVESMQTTRNELFTFLMYMPQDKLAEARHRVERENVDNREEFGGDENAGVYRPVKLPWKE
jgi:hypothetical protein